MKRTAIIITACVAIFGSIAVAQSAASVKISTPGQDGNAAAYYAQDMGYFRAHGLEAEIMTINRGGGAANAAAVIGGSVDIGEADLIAIAAARQHGLPLVILAPAAVYETSTPSAALFVAKSSTIRTAKDLEGKTIAVPSLEGPGRVGTASWIEANGGDLSRVKFTELAQAEMAAAVDRGSVDAATATEPTVTRAQAVVRIIGRPYDSIAKRFIDSAWFASEDWVRAHSDTATRFALAIHDADHWANANRPKSAEIFVRYSKMPPEIVAAMPRATYGESIDPALMQPLLDAAVKYKSLAHPVAARDLISSIVK